MELQGRRPVPWYVISDVYLSGRYEAWLPSDIANVARDIALPPPGEAHRTQIRQRAFKILAEAEPSIEETIRTRDSTQSRVMLLSAPTGLFIAAGPVGARIAVFRALLRYLSRSDVCKQIDERFLTKQLVFFASDQNAEQTVDIEAQLHDTTHIMKDNLGKIMERHERIDSIADLSEDLLLESNQFKQTSKRVEAAGRTKNCKLTAWIVCLLVCIFLMLGGGTFLGVFFDVIKSPF